MKRTAAVFALALGFCASAHALNTADIALANGYDDAWESNWASTMKTVHDSFAGTAGLAVHVGDSITYANPYTQWIRYGAGRTAEDNAIRGYFNVDGPTHAIDGLYLSRTDVSGGSYTAESGMDAGEYLADPVNGLPSCDEMFVTGAVGGAYSGYSNLTGARAAEVCILMLGSNDVGAGRSATAFRASMVSIITKIMQNNNTIVCLSTIPPHHANNTLAQQLNTEIRDIAQNGLVIPGVNGGGRVYFPLIDFYQAIVYRRPSDWNGTLMGTNDEHPSSVNSAGDPYANGGALLSDDGYLLRCWLSFQKLKEIKRYCIDGNLPPPTTPNAPSADAGSDQINAEAGAVIQLNGSLSQDAVTFSWSYAVDSDATPALMPSADVPNPTFTAGPPGTNYHLDLTVTDGVSQTDADSVWIRIDPAYTVALIMGNTTAFALAPVTLSASDSWTYTGAATYSWAVDPPPADLSGQGTDTIQFTSGEVGESLDVTLTVDDLQGHTDQANLIVSVVGPDTGGSSGVSCTTDSHTSSGIPASALILIATLSGMRRRSRAPRALRG